LEQKRAREQPERYTGEETVRGPRRQKENGHPEGVENGVLGG
jgi:hypothetical protein